MASTEPMTLDTMQREIHALFQNGIDVPVKGDEDYELRTVLVNKFIGDWEMRKGMKWRVLFTVDSTKTFHVASASYSCNSAFRRIGGKVKLLLGTQSLDVPYLSQERLDDDVMPATYCYIQGKPGSFSLVFYGVPAQWEGAQIRYRYQRFATKMTAVGDIPDMSDPRFIVSSVAARLFQLGRNNTGYTINFNDAEEYMSGMIVANAERGLGEHQLPVGHRIQSYGTMGM